jgi:hypothetical protein
MASRNVSKLMHWAKGIGSQASKTSPAIILIDNHFHSRVYTTGSTISGFVSIDPEQDILYDRVEISLTGTSRVESDFLQQHAIGVEHEFLHLQMLIVESTLPNTRLLEVGNTYRVPFTFVIPHQLPSQSCRHPCSSLATKENHLRTPPSVGYWDGELDDHAPSISKISYAINFRLFGNLLDDKKRKPYMVIQSCLKFQVLPLVPEEAPLDVALQTPEYQLSYNKNIRSTLLSRKKAHLSANTTQPQAVLLTADGRRTSTLFTTISLNFTSFNTDTKPPHLNQVTARLESTTFLSLQPFVALPILNPDASTMDPVRPYLTSTKLIVEPIGNLDWRLTSSFTGMDTGSSVESEVLRENKRHDQGEERLQAQPRSFTAVAEVSLDIPYSSKRMFLPTFHSCFISRIYRLHLDLYLGSQNTTVSMVVPLQIATKECISSDIDELPEYTGAESSISGTSDTLLPPYE